MLDTISIFSYLIMLAIAHNRFYRPVEDIKVKIYSKVNPCLWLNTFFYISYSALVISFSQKLDVSGLFSSKCRHVGLEEKRIVLRR